MRSEVKRDRAQLRDMSAAQGLYDVDYMLHINTRAVENITRAPMLKKTITANIQSVGGRKLKDGKYELEKNGKVLYQLEKSGTDWHVISSNQNVRKKI